MEKVAVFDECNERILLYDQMVLFHLWHLPKLADFTRFAHYLIPVLTLYRLCQYLGSRSWCWDESESKKVS